ncbi:alginate export family protein [Oceanobacter kriegii]|uniref:alginate export family protein n=1 Tax=Oceanobacter kriegii TaxID=64972 RepID=UPI0003F8DB11|nr:alginate export family protein [Oceanobacter kriegii]
MYTKSLLAAAIAMTTAAVSQTASAETDVAKALTEGKPIAQFNLRYETNDTDNTLDAATALTLGSNLGYETGSLYGFKALVELEDTRALIDEYNPEDAQYNTVADPVNTEFNRVQISYAKDGVSAVLGRQRIILDNARFVGNVGWRQNEQTFDAFKAGFSNDDWDVTYAYIDKINTILFTQIDVANNLFNVSYKGLEAGKLTGYGYYQKNEDNPANAASNADTLGVRFAGKHALESTTLMYTAEYAMQDAKDYSANYLFAELGATLGKAKVFAGYEVLGSDDGAYGFQTFMATKHAFNGWADKFLSTPASGLTDTYLKAVGNVAGVKLVGMYHMFDADEGGADLGSELDLLAVKKIDDMFTVGLKAAMYSKGDSGADTDKLWAWVSAKF